MKFKISALLFFFAFALSLNAQTIFLSENFSYPAGDSIGGHGWTTFSSWTNPISVTSPGLTFTGYSYSGVGNACRLKNNGQDAYKDFTAPVTSGSVFCSFMLKVDSVQAVGGDYCFAELPSTSTTNYTSRFYLKDSLGGVMIGITKGAVATNPIVWAPTPYLKNTTYLIVVKYKFIPTTTTDDEISVFVFSSTIPNTEPSTPTIGPVTSSATNDATDIGRVALRQGSGAIAPTVTIDGIMAFVAWSSLVSVHQTGTTVAENFALSQNYPNPFNPVTNINFSIPKEGFVNLRVYNILGLEVSNLINSKFTIGTYSVKFDGSNLNSGVYYYKLELNTIDGKQYSDVKKLMLVK